MQSLQHGSRTEPVSIEELDFDFAPVCEFDDTRIFYQTIVGAGENRCSAEAEYHAVGCCVDKFYCEEHMFLKLSVPSVTCIVCWANYQPGRAAYRQINRI